MARGNGSGRRAGGRARSDAEEALEDSLSHGQTYVRDIQKFLVPRVIANSGYRWHNAANRNEMMQILRALTIEKGGAYVHWDALAARSAHLKTNNLKALGSKIAMSHAHATRNHQAFVSRAVARLFGACSSLRPTTKNSPLSRRRFLESSTEVPSSASIIQL